MRQRPSKFAHVCMIVFKTFLEFRRGAGWSLFPGFVLGSSCSPTSRAESVRHAMRQEEYTTWESCDGEAVASCRTHHWSRSRGCLGGTCDGAFVIIDSMCGFIQGCSIFKGAAQRTQSSCFFPFQAEDAKSAAAGRAYDERSQEILQASSSVIRRVVANAFAPLRR